MSTQQIRLLASVFLIVAGSIVAGVGSANEPAAAPPAKNVKEGLSLTTQLLQLMDTDKSGKVSKEEFMRFMQAEFELADVNKDGELDPKELRHLQFMLSHPTRGPGR